MSLLSKNHINLSKNIKVTDRHRSMIDAQYFYQSTKQLYVVKNKFRYCKVCEEVIAESMGVKHVCDI